MLTTYDFIYWKLMMRDHLDQTDPDEWNLNNEAQTPLLRFRTLIVLTIFCAKQVLLLSMIAVLHAKSIP